ncbi:hypothetical protein HRbin24_00252 [bacterium HR24]|nr:hypothetical protein HRbin24_00252 [bacterium HR24]
MRTASRNLLVRHQYYETLEGVHREPVVVTASDGIQTLGLLHEPPTGRARTALLVIHPRADFTRHYLAPLLAQRGYAVLGHNSRYVNNDSDALHERMLLDIAAALRELRARGYERLVLLGNSGGGSLTAFYQWQATTPPAERLTASPAGDPVPLAEEDMPVAEAMVHIAVHSGQGNVMRRVIDPAVVDENDPLLTDSSVDMYHPANGRRPWPEPSRYDRGWLQAYWRAQEERCRRLDVLARAYLDEHSAAEAGDGGPEGRYARERRRRLARYLVVYRTLADPAYLDPSIDPSERPLGSMFTPGLDPVVGNYGPGGLGRVLTPRGWLSTWSPFSTNADLTRSLRHITCPCLFVQATGDTEIRPQEFAAIVASSAASDKTAVEVRGDHYLLPLEGQEDDPRPKAADIIADWLAARVPPR